MIWSLHFNPSHPNHERREKIKLNFYFDTSLWCLLFQYNFQKCTGHKGLIAPRKLMFDSTFNLETFLRAPKLKYWPTHSKVHWLFYQFISPKQNKET